METQEKIEFQELSTRAGEFLHELSDPNLLLRDRKLPRRAAAEMRRHQIGRLKDNIAFLLAKRTEFNRRMQEYIANLEALVQSLERSLEAESDACTAHGTPARGTQVRCLGCETVRTFRGIEIIFARESDESIAMPTQLYVLENGILKKGHFKCGACGTQSLVIRASE